MHCLITEETDDKVCYFLKPILLLHILTRQFNLCVNPIQARLFLPFKGPREGSLGTPLMISGTIKASPMKLCTVIVLLKAYQNTKENFQNYDL